MNGGTIRRYTADELRRMAERGESRTDIARLQAMSDQEVERAIANDPDWEGVPDDWSERAEAVMPRPKVPVSIRLDADVVERYRAMGRGWQTRINAILRAYLEARETKAR